jgi:hypothetical protein
MLYPEFIEGPLHKISTILQHVECGGLAAAMESGISMPRT